MSPRRALEVLLALLAVAAAFGTGVYVTSFSRGLPEIVLSNSRSIQLCVEQNIVLTKPLNLDTETIDKVIGVCSHEIESQAHLNDFLIRRIGFMNQYYADRITLWMVVIITLSGVLLAGLQLAASYRLAVIKGGDLAEGNEISVEQGKLIFRSSVTGLTVLIISFAFFLTYVHYIYKLDIVNVDPPTQNGSAATFAPLSPGGLGSPPSTLPRPSVTPSATNSGR